MEAKLINIGNSKGILIPATILKLLRFTDKVQIGIEDNKLIIESLSAKPRANWADRFARADSLNGEPELIPDVFEDESFKDWKW
jgi:antitoxin MazE